MRFFVFCFVYLVLLPSCLWCDPAWRWQHAHTLERSTVRTGKEHNTSSGHICVCVTSDQQFLPFRLIGGFTSLTFKQNQMVMGNRRIAHKPERMTMNQPTQPKDPVLSAGERKRDLFQYSHQFDEQKPVWSPWIQRCSETIHVTVLCWDTKQSIQWGRFSDYWQWLL